MLSLDLNWLRSRRVAARHIRRLVGEKSLSCAFRLNYLDTLRFISSEPQSSLVRLGRAYAAEAIGSDVQLVWRFEELTLPWQ